MSIYAHIFSIELCNIVQYFVALQLWRQYMLIRSKQIKQLFKKNEAVYNAEWKLIDNTLIFQL